MATIVANPYYDDPFLSSIASNISRVFIDRNPGQTAAGRAQARLYGLKADEIESNRAARTKIGQAITTPAGPNGTHTPEQIRQMTADGIIGNYEAKELSNHYLFAVANSGQKTPIVQAALTGTGRPLGDNQSVTTEQHDSNLARDERSKANVAAIGAGPGYARVAEAKRAHETEMEFKERTRWDKPVEVSRDAAVFGVPDDPRLKGVPPGTIPAPGPDKMIAGYDADGQPIHIDASKAAGQRRPPTAAEVTQAKPTPPPRPGDINSPKEVSDAEWNILSKLGAVGSDGKIDPDFIAEFGDRMPEALSAIGAPGTSAGSAEATYLKALGIEPGSSWERGGWFSKPQLNKPKSKIGAAVTSAPPPAGAARPSAPQQSVAPPPNPADRKAGMVYATPRGPMTWTGTGWVPAGTK